MPHIPEEFHEAVNGYVQAVDEFERFKKDSIPLCAAETEISQLVRSPLGSSMHERYIMGGVLDLDTEDNFVGAEMIYPLYGLVQKLCATLFGCDYADPRTLSGMNAGTTLMMSLCPIGAKVLLLVPDSGGHQSFPAIFDRLGFDVVELPYDYEALDLNYDGINQLLQSDDFDAIYLVPSDLVNPPNLSKIKQPETCHLVYDATQTLGLIAGGVVPNPFEENEKAIVIGATHKTMPGPTCGLIMTKNNQVKELIDKTINPVFIRNTQPHQIASLILCLAEFLVVGEDYSRAIVENGNTLGEALERRDFAVMKAHCGYTQTHQVFVEIPPSELDAFYETTEANKITLNKKTKKLFRGSGVRIGVQDATRWGWMDDEFEMVAELLHKIRDFNANKTVVKELIRELVSRKELAFTVETDAVRSLLKENRSDDSAV